MINWFKLCTMLLCFSHRFLPFDSERHISFFRGFDKNRGVKLNFIPGHIGIMVALKGPVVILIIYKYTYVNILYILNNVLYYIVGPALDYYQFW